MGTPKFAVPVLSALLDAGHNIVSVYSKPDKPHGRGKHREHTSVKMFTKERNIPIYQPHSLKAPREQEQLFSLSPDLIVVAAYGLFLPPAILEVPKLGCLNVHPSLLPKYRGPAPVSSAILNGDSVTGVTIMKIEEEMDAGPILTSQPVDINPEDNTDGLTMRLFQVGASMMVDSVPKWASGTLPAFPQNNSKATLTRRLSKKDGQITWDFHAATIARQVRAYHPWPGTFTHLDGKLLKIIDASVIEGQNIVPGTIMLMSDKRIGISTGCGVLDIRRLQLEGRPIVDSSEFIRGHSHLIGSIVK